MPSPHQLTSLSDAGWCRLVASHEPMLRAISRSYGLSRDQADDALQNTWLRLFRSAAGIRQPGAVSAWLATTVRRECLHLLQSNVREVLTDDPELGPDGHGQTPEEVLLAAERRAVVTRALSTLPSRRGALLRLIAAEEDYSDIGERLAMPVGSIGPTRARALEQLRQHPELLALHRAA